MTFTTRFAPSPTGRLHIGHAYSALIAHDAAMAVGGRFLLRIEDIDRARCREAFEAQIYADLAWLKIDWEKPVRRQSEHFDDYEAALERLKERGLVYRCFKTRREIADDIARAPHLAPAGPEGPQYVGAPLPRTEEERRLADGEAFAWRLSMSAARDYLGAGVKALEFTEDSHRAEHAIRATPEIFGDVVIARKDNGVSYHLAATLDDALQGVTHVIRGEDLRAAAHMHRLLQALLDLPTPVYRHHRLITDPAGKRLAKRDHAATLQAWRERGASPAALRAHLALE
ncbi:MAG: tRNA glutamyl-Q(34) synthetase GluQRS [Pseudomonadota bacterium]